MRITRLKLKNFIGIFNGMGKEEIEIFFPENKNQMTMLVGKNGSGKSTILSQLHPFKDSFDERKSLILPGKEGLKEIDFYNNGHVYKVKHIYGKTTSSFLSEDGVELNENGGVRTFEELIRQKFKLDKEYFKIGKIGSNTTNFIQFTPTQRKTYISTFVEEVQKYLDAYKVVSDKVKLQENTIKQISNDLKKYYSKDEIYKKINEYTQQSEKIKKDLDFDIKLRIEKNLQLNNINTELNKINYLDIKNKLLYATQLNKNNTILLNKYLSTYPNIKDKIDDYIKILTEEKNNLFNEINILNIKYTTSNENKVSLENQKIKISSQLKGIEKIDLKEYENKIKKLSDDIDDYTKKLDTPYALSLKDNDKKILYLDYFKNFLKVVENNYSLLNSDSFIENKTYVELFFSKDFTTEYKKYVTNINQEIIKYENILETKNKEYALKNSNLSKLEILNKRPKNCKINTCPFIADALQYVNLDKEIETLEKEINEIKENIKNKKELINSMSDIVVKYSNIAKAFNLLDNKNNICYKEFIKRNNNIKVFIKKSYNDLVDLTNSFIIETEDIFNLLNNLKESNESLKYYTLKYNETKKISETEQYFEQELKTIEEKLKNTLIENKQIKETLEQKKNDFTTKENTLNDYNNIKEILNSNNSIEEEIKSYNNSISIFNQFSADKKTIMSELTNIEKRINDNTELKKKIDNEITDLKASEKIVDSLNNNLKDINENYSKTNVIKKALNPKSGIPLIFIKSYLEGAEIIANELLKSAFDGNFEIKFVPTNTDFFIQVRYGENIIEDIKLASQGEIALTTISISLALIERTIGDYNILYLDEIDGPLDFKNRKSFIDILNKQIEKLNLEQIFIISHNNAFDSYNMNLILLPGSQSIKENSEFMENKEIIFDAS